MIRLPSKDSSTWRAIITAIQALAGCFVAAVAIPEFRQTITQFYPAALPVIVSVAGIVSFILNYFRPSVRNY
jgi:hypothetical protein